MKHFKKENIYPNEAFIQKALEDYFFQNKYEINKDGQIDLIATKKNDIWIIEAKGLTSSINVDFNTCIGQLAKSINDDNVNYAIAVPNEPKYKRQCSMLSTYFREKNNIFLILVDEKGDLQFVKPSESLTV